MYALLMQNYHIVHQVLEFQNIQIVNTLHAKPPNISPGLIFVRKHFLVDLYMGGLYTGGVYPDKILC